MESRPATIVDTYLGYWADEILVAFLLVDFGGVIRAVGGHLLNSTDPATNRAHGERFAIRLMHACGARRWSDLDGLPIEVLFDAPFPWGNAIGVRGASGSGDGQFLFEEPELPTTDGDHADALAAVGVRPLNAPPTALVSAL